jgi:NAD(P)H-dependent FMN reductase
MGLREKRQRGKAKMHVLCILGGPQKFGKTYNVVHLLTSRILSGTAITIEYVRLRDLNIRQCTGCFSCNLNGIETCPLQDDVQGILDKMRRSDGLILAAPTYTENVPALTKSFFDRLNYLYHRPEFFGKKAVVVSTVGFYGIKGALRQLGSVRDWGYDVVDELGIVPAPFDLKYKKQIEDKIGKRIDRTADKLINALSKPKKINFNFFNFAKFQAIKASSITTRYYSKADFHYYKDKENYVAVKTPFYAKPFALLMRTMIPLMVKNKFDGIKT